MKCLGSILLGLGFLVGSIAEGQVFKHQFQFKNGSILAFLERPHLGYLPGLFLKAPGSDSFEPVESDPRQKEGTGELLFIESTQLSERRVYEGAIQVLGAARSEIAFAVIGHRLMAIRQDGHFQELSDLALVLERHPHAEVRVVTAPETVREAGGIYRALEVQYYLKDSDGKYRVVIERGVVDQNLRFQSFPIEKGLLIEPKVLPAELHFEKLTTSSGTLLALDHLSPESGPGHSARSQVDLKHLDDLEKGASVFPLNGWSGSPELPGGPYFSRAMARESFKEFQARGAEPTRLRQSLSELRPPAMGGELQTVMLRDQSELEFALSYFSYTRDGSLKSWPVFLYRRPEGALSEPELERYFDRVALMKGRVISEPAILIVPGEAGGSFRIHVVDAHNGARFFDYLKPAFNACEFLLKSVDHQ